MHFRMKVNYSNWYRRLYLHENVKKSIELTVNEKFKLCARNLQQFICHEDGVPLYYGQNSDLSQAYPSKQAFTTLIAKLLV